MLAVDGSGIPLNLLTESANISEFKLALQTVDGISVATRPLHPRKRPDMLIADKGYDAEWLRNALSRRTIRPYIPKRRKKGQEEEPAYNKTIQHLYATRWIVERTNAWLQNYRRITVRWDRSADTYEAFIELACILICLRRVLR
jgi:transposase